jgi:hypothetical protein
MTRDRDESPFDLRGPCDEDEALRKRQHEREPKGALVTQTECLAGYSHRNGRRAYLNLVVKMARMVDEAANFVFVQLTGIYDKHHPDCAKRDKIGLAWERISHETKESGYRLSSFETI